MGVLSRASVGAGFREWRVNWMWMVAAGLLVMVIPVLSVVTLSTNPVGLGASLRDQLLWHVLYPAIYGIHASFTNIPAVVTIQAEPGLSGLIVLTALGLGIVLVTAERNSGVLRYTWTLTLPRRKVYEVKWLFGGAVLFVAMAINAILLLGGDWIVGSPLAYSVIGQWLWLNTVLALMCFSLGMAIGSVVGMGINAFLVAIGFLLLPLGASEVLAWIFVPGESLPARAWLRPVSAFNEAASWLSSMSPFHYITFITSAGITSRQLMGDASAVTTRATFIGTHYGHLGWWWTLFAALTVLFWRCGRSWYQQVGIERYDHVFMLSGLWRLVHMLVAIVLGVILLQIALPDTTGVQAFLVWLLLSGVIWLLVYTLLRLLPESR